MSNSVKQAFFEQFYYAMDANGDSNMTSTCSTNEDCSDGEITKCCVSITMTSLETGETDSLSRCMTEGVVEGNWDWAMQTEGEDADEMTVSMKCMEKASGSAYFNSLSVLAASLLLIASIVV